MHPGAARDITAPRLMTSAAGLKSAVATGPSAGTPPSLPLRINQVRGHWHFNLPEKKVRPAGGGHSNLPEIPPEGIEALQLELGSRIGLQKPFALSVETLERPKNVTTLVEAFARVAMNWVCSV